ncbi:MAG: serine hydrolase [Chloroflexota bacterium]
MGTRLARSSPESQGISSAAILAFIEAVQDQIHELHSFILVRHGQVVAEGWWPPYGPEKLHMLFSLSKSFTSSAIGLAVAEGRLSIDDTVLSFFPDDAPAEISPKLAAMRVRHLLTMSTGHDHDTMAPLHQRQDGNWVRAFLEQPLEFEPGTHFFYNTAATFMLSAIIQKLTGMKLIDYLQPRLLEPLGIEGSWWEESPQGINMGGFGYNLKTEDIACFGQMYLQKGLWNGRQILPEAWVEQASSKHIQNQHETNADWRQGYGFQFWRCQPQGVYRGDGAFGQYCIVMPEQDAVLAITSGVSNMQQPLDLVWDLLLPTLGSTAALPEDGTGQAALKAKIASLNLDPQQGAASSPIAAKVSGRTYAADANELHIETICFDFADTRCAVTFKLAGHDFNFAGGYGLWQEGSTNMFSPPYNPIERKLVASGVWTADDTFTMTIRMYETPIYQTLVARFEEGQLTLDSFPNVAFELKREVISAHVV